QSFVRRAADCRRTRDLIREFGGDDTDRSVRLIAKIEKPEAVEDLSDILDTADGVMVARGDLAVETAPERVPVLQKKIISQALDAEKTIITATQMLQSMVESPWPTRAEASDVSNAVLDGSDAVMLSEETAIGHFPVESILMMDRIIRSTEESNLPQNASIRKSLFNRKQGSYGRAIAEAAVYAAEEIDSRLIVVLSGVGYMARHVAALRPRQRIIAFTPVRRTYDQLAITWGVEGYLVEEVSSGKGMLLARADRLLLDRKLAERGEGIVVITGKVDDPARSYSMKLHRVGDLTKGA
ncbi:MAG: pyruvate kinase, partial [Blastocatellia bacterium]|nr:pyruvate kinase [Blastocatellia bacterium]